MKRAINLTGLTALLIGLPLAGVIVAGRHVSSYLEFPPRTQTVEHAPFSWPVFIGLALFILAVIVPFLVRIVTSRGLCPKKPARHPFPWWGWAGLVFGIVAWVLAWTRFDWFAPLQRYSFTPPWIAYIIVVNALTARRTGRCLLTHRTRYFLWLFPLSASFWWFFEYLNRFVQNWYYTACSDLSGLEYFITATLPFATVLPAVLSTEVWLASNPRTSAGLETFPVIRFKRPRLLAGTTLFVSSAGLFFIGWFSDQLFPLLWVSPLLLILSFQCLEKGQSFFPELGIGDWRRVFRFCLAALICGFFWEMWNMYSLSQWIYTVPYVSRFHLFEMPLLGFSGYLPFGLECAVIAELFLKPKERIK